MLIEARIDYKTSIYDNLVKLLEAIKERVLNYQELCYNMVIILDSFRVFLNWKECNKESLQDHAKYFKVSKEILESYLGRPIVIEKIAKNHPNYNKTD